MTHPDEGAWMSFLYSESPDEVRRDLESHLATCSRCAAQVETWRASMTELDAWKIPVRRRRAERVAPALKWAAAAAAVLIIGFLVGRNTSSSASEIAALKASMAQLKDSLQGQSAATFSNSVAASTAAASSQTLRLLTDYSQALEAQRSTDRQAFNLALRTIDTRMNRMSDDLEAVALSTETGFQETHENITRVATLSLAAKNQD
jgi:anti-sigma factor RsiW